MTEILPLYCPIPDWDNDSWIYTLYVADDKVYSMQLTPKSYKRSFGLILDLYQYMIEQGYNVTPKNAKSLEFFLENGNIMASYSYFVGACMNKDHADDVIKWIVGPLREVMNERGFEHPSKFCFHAPDLYGLVEKIIEKRITPTMGKEIIRLMADGHTLDDCLKMEKFVIAESSDLDKWVDDAITGNPDVCAKFKSGDAKMINWLVGVVMKAARGKANASLVKESLIAKL